MTARDVSCLNDNPVLFILVLRCDACECTMKGTFLLCSLSLNPRVVWVVLVGFVASQPVVCFAVMTLIRWLLSFYNILFLYSSKSQAWGDFKGVLCS